MGDFMPEKSDESFSKCFSSANDIGRLFDELERFDEPNPMFMLSYPEQEPVAEQEPNHPHTFEYVDDSTTTHNQPNAVFVNKHESTFTDSFPSQPQSDVMCSPRPPTPGTSHAFVPGWQQDHVIPPLNYHSMNDAGMYDFQINFKKETKLPSKNAAYTYSHEIRKLFANINKRVPINIQCKTAPPANSRVRITAFYKKPVDANDIIRQCPNHSNMIGEQIGNTHFIIAEMAPKSYVKYECDRNGHESVTILYESDALTAVVRFMCLSSCKVINRREMVLVLDLENENGMLLGRQTVDFCVSTCPGRDRPKAEGQRFDLEPQRKRRRVPASGALANVTNNVSNNAGRICGEGMFTLHVKDYEHFVILKQIKEALEYKKAAEDKNLHCASED